MNEKDRLLAEKQAEEKKALEDGLLEIKEHLTRPNGKFKFFKREYEENDTNGKVLFSVEGYTSGLLNVFVDSHNKEVSIGTSKKYGGNQIMPSNKTMAANPKVFIKFLGEFQKHYEQLLVNAKKPQR